MELQIVNLVVTIVNLLLTLVIAPLVAAFITFLNRIEKSSCCGGNLELADLKHTVSMSHDEIQRIKKSIDAFTPPHQTLPIPIRTSSHPL
jgi:hypothetical protein